MRRYEYGFEMASGGGFFNHADSRILALVGAARMRARYHDYLRSPDLLPTLRADILNGRAVVRRVHAR